MNVSTILLPFAFVGFSACSSLSEEKAPAGPAETRAIIARIDELREIVLGYSLTEVDEDGKELWRKALRALGEARERFVRKLPRR